MQMKAKNIVLSRLLPKTGQSISYRARDDGEIEAGWWRGLLNANNKTRFIAKTIGGDDVVIDLATGLMWAANGNKAGCNNGNELEWGEAIDYANALDFAGFTDWRLPNINELGSIVDFSAVNPAIYTSFFPNTAADIYLSSTSRQAPTTYAWYIEFWYGMRGSQAKDVHNHIRCVRGGL